MCGIFATRLVVKSWFQSSFSKYFDRGPDQKAIYIEKDIGIAVNRQENRNLYSVNSN